MSPEKFKIGFAAPLTGEQSIVAIPMLNAARLAINNFIDKGAHFNLSVDIFPLDDQASATEAKKVAASFVSDPCVIAVIGHKNSECTNAAGSAYNHNHLTVVTPSATGDVLTEQGWSNFYRLCADDRKQGRAAASFAVNELKASNVLILRDETDYGNSLARQFSQFFEDYSGTVSKVKELKQGSLNIDHILPSISSIKPDLIYMALTEIESALVAKEVYKHGVEVLLLGADGSKNSKFPSLAGEAANGAYMTYAGALPENNPRGVEFLERYEKQYGECPVYGAETYDAVMLILEAMNQVLSPTRKMIIDAIRSIGLYEGASGKICFNEKGERKTAPVSIWHVQNNEMNFYKIIT